MQAPAAVEQYLTRPFPALRPDPGDHLRGGGGAVRAHLLPLAHRARARGRRGLSAQEPVHGQPLGALPGLLGEPAAAAGQLLAVRLHLQAGALLGAAAHDAVDPPAAAAAPRPVRPLPQPGTGPTVPAHHQHDTREWGRKEFFNDLHLHLIFIDIPSLIL